jgi:hypothetical protein
LAIDLAYRDERSALKNIFRFSHRDKQLCGDKMKVLILLLSMSFGLFADEQIRWSEGEHLELGDNGAKSACSELGLSNSECPVLAMIPRADNKVLFSYGEIILSVDFYSSATDMYKDRTRGIKKIIACAHRQTSADGDQERGNEEYPSCTGTAVTTMPTFLEVVSKNYDHFGWNNMTAYVRMHEQALLKAQLAYTKKKSDPAGSKLLMNQSLIYNAFADHYLTDAFASGHIRVPRAQIVKWAEKRLRGYRKASRGDLLTMMLHDRESISLRTQKEDGLAVENSKGDRWTTRGDSHLHLRSYPGDPTRELPEQAVRESVKELLTAWKTGELPEGIYKATAFVPFYKGVPLAEKMTPLYQGMTKKDFYKSLYGNMSLFDKWLHRPDDMEKMLSDLPEIYAVFRQDISKDLQSNPVLKNRLPPEYIEAFLSVR